LSERKATHCESSQSLRLSSTQSLLMRDRGPPASRDATGLRAPWENQTLRAICGQSAGRRNGAPFVRLPRAACAVGSGDPMVQQVGGRPTRGFLSARNPCRRRRLGRPRQGGERRRCPIAEGLSRLHRADLSWDPPALEQRSDLQRAIRARGRRPAQGGVPEGEAKKD
jgi:hypothetical protein